jgi:hypothetical protein
MNLTSDFIISPMLVKCFHFTVMNYNFCDIQASALLYIAYISAVESTVF